MNWEKAAKVLAMGISAISAVVDHADDALPAIRGIIDALKGGNLAALDPEKAHKDLEQLIKSLAENDAAADEAVENKFDN